MVRPAAEGETRAALAQVRASVAEGRFGRAKEVLDGMDRRAKADVEVLYYRAFLTHRVEGRPDKAAKMFGEALRRIRSGRAKVADPFLEVKAVFYRAYALAEAGKGDEAEKGFNEAFSLLDSMDRAGRLNDGQGYYMMAYCYDLRREAGLSESYYGRAAAYFATNAPTHYLYGGSFFNIGRIHYNRQDFRSAMRWWEKALAVSAEDGPFTAHYRQWYETARQSAGF